MHSIVDLTEIMCPRCGEEFAGWQSTSLPPAESAVCPRCGHDLATDPLFHEDGIWVLESQEDELRNR